MFCNKTPLIRYPNYLMVQEMAHLVLFLAVLLYALSPVPRQEL